jgi:hypothetical protein
MCGFNRLPHSLSHICGPGNASFAGKTLSPDAPKGCAAPGSTDACDEPNRYGGPVEDKSVMEPPLKISGDAEGFNHRRRPLFCSRTMQ